MLTKTIRQFADFFDDRRCRIDLRKAGGFEAGAIVDAIQCKKAVQTDEFLSHPPRKTGRRKDCIDQAGGASDGGLAAKESGGTDQSFGIGSKKAFQGDLCLERGAAILSDLKSHCGFPFLKRQRSVLVKVAPWIWVQ